MAHYYYRLISARYQETDIGFRYRADMASTLQNRHRADIEIRYHADIEKISARYRADI